jgi:uncharacterized membrane protein HdeD (DUF308 family)
MEKVKDEIVAGLAARWWTLLVRGIAAILFGVYALLRPGPSLVALVLVWGAYALVDGVFALVLAARRGRSGERWGWYFFEGVTSIAAGVLAFALPGITAVALTTMMGAWAVLTGVAEIVAAIELRKVIRGEWLLAASGVLSIGFGLLAFAFPLAGALSIVWLIGAYAIGFGVVLAVLAFRVRRWGAGENTAVPGGTPRFA